MRLKTLFWDDSYGLVFSGRKVVPEDVISSTFPDVQEREENEFMKSILWSRSRSTWYCDQKYSTILLHENCIVQQKKQTKKQHYTIKKKNTKKPHNKSKSARNKVALFYCLFMSCKIVTDQVWQKKSINFILVHDFVSRLRQLTSIGLKIFMTSVDATLHFFYLRQMEDCILGYLEDSILGYLEDSILGYL